MTSIIMAYARTGSPENAELLINEMREEMGLQPDVVCYTALIDGYFKKNKIDRCWELYDECSEKRLPGQDLDEVLMSYMIRVSAATHDSEKAMRLFNDLQVDGFVEHVKPYNSVMMACSSTKRFSAKTIEFWHTMHMKNIPGDQVTYVAVLRACAKLGDVQTAYDALLEMKNAGLKINEHIFNQLLKVYAGACRLPDVEEKHVERYLEDAMDLFETQIEPQDLVNVHILNSLVILFSNALKAELVEQKILPLYSKHRIEHDMYTF